MPRWRLTLRRVQYPGALYRGRRLRRVVNPMIVDGQVHGGIGQGVGQALWEEVAYDRETGQLLTGSFMDYVMPKADHLPMFTVGHNKVLTPTNRMGAKGGVKRHDSAPAAIVNAICGALSDYGVEHIQMPVTSEKSGGRSRVLNV